MLPFVIYLYKIYVYKMLLCIVNYPLRLRNGTSPFDGRLEVLNNGVWGSVCNDSFDDVDATVACRQLGFNL